jgi:hypothetical protein
MLNMLGLLLLTTLAATPNNSYYNLTENLNLFYGWQVALMTLAFRQWCRFSLTKSLFLAALPLLLIFGSWALLV